MEMLLSTLSTLKPQDFELVTTPSLYFMFNKKTMAIMNPYATILVAVVAATALPTT